MTSDARLIVLGSSLTALAVGRDAFELGLAPAVVDKQPGVACLSRRVEPIVLPSDASDSDALDAVLRLASPGGYLIATSDSWLRFVVTYRRQLERAFRAVLHPSSDALEICLDKGRFGAWCEAQRLASPKTWLVGQGPRPRDLLPPLLVRPASTAHAGTSAGLPKAVDVATEAELGPWLARFAERNCGAVVSESLLHLPLTQFSVPFVRAPGHFELFVARKVRPAPRHCSVGSYVELAPQDEVASLVSRAAAALDYFGIGEAEVLRDDSTGRLFLIEINARPWLQYALAPASGHDFLGIMTGRPRALPRFTEGRRWLDFESDVFGAFSSSVGAVRLGELGLGSYLLSLWRANVYARFDLLDPMPVLRRSGRRVGP